MVFYFMKSQDVLLLFKLVCLHKREQEHFNNAPRAWPLDWQDWEEESGFIGAYSESPIYTARALEEVTGISKSQVNLSIRRCLDVGLIRFDRNLGTPRVNRRALFEFVVYGLKYVFPAKPAEITRGIATAFAAPVLNEVLISGGELVPVWPYAQGHTKGQAVEPIYKSVVFAVRKDPELYAMLALVDAIRIGMPREVSLAKDILKQHLEVG